MLNIGGPLDNGLIHLQGLEPEADQRDSGDGDKPDGNEIRYVDIYHFVKPHYIQLIEVPVSGSSGVLGSSTGL